MMRPFSKRLVLALARAKAPYWLAILAYNRGRAGALAALNNPRACGHAEFVVKVWARIEATTGLDSSTARPPAFPPLPEEDLFHLAVGDVRPDVEALQRLLNDRLAPSPPLNYDGRFGSATRDALIRFQRARNLHPTGTADAPTWAALLEIEVSKAHGVAPPLVMGQLSRDVQSLQRQLNNRVVPSPALIVDGNFGAATCDALIRFQRSRGIPPTGAVDAQTMKALDSPENDPAAIDGDANR